MARHGLQYQSGRYEGALSTIMMVLVTGASGFVGSHVSKLLAESGFGVRMLMRAPRSGQPHHGFVCLGNLLNRNDLLAATKDVDVVVHAAGLAHREATYKEFEEINVMGTLQLAEAAVLNGVKHFIFLSSVAVYGSSCQPWREGQVCQPITPYGHSKQMAEYVLRQTLAGTGMGLTILRPGLIYGERDTGNLMKLIRFSSRYMPFVLGHGYNQKSMTYVGNMALLCRRLLQNLPTGTNIWNVADPVPYRLNEIMYQIARHLGSSRVVRIPRVLALVAGGGLSVLARVLRTESPITASQVRVLTSNAICSVGAIQREVNFSSVFGLGEGIGRTIEWYRGGERGLLPMDTSCRG